MQVALDVLGILAIIGFGAFVIVLVADLLISIFDKHEGIFFNKKKKTKSPKKKNDAVVYTGSNSGKPVKNTEKKDTDSDNKEEKPIIAIDVLGIKEKPINSVENVLLTPVDMQKAEEEEKILKQKFAEVNAIEEFDTFENKVSTPVMMPTQEGNFSRKPSLVQEDNLDKVLPNILKQALDSTGMNLKEQKVDVYSMVEEPIIDDLPEPEPAKVKIIYRPKLEKSGLEEIKDDVFRMKKDAILTKHNKKKRVIIEEDEDDEGERGGTGSRVDAAELKKQKLAFATEKIRLIQQQADQTKKNKALEAEKKKLEEEIESLRKDLKTPKRPYYSKEYYEKKLVKLERDLKEAQKELRLNKKEYIPLKKVKKVYERDSVKLKKQEELVAKQKIALYGSGASTKVIPEKKAKLDENVKLLNDLKDSVYNCKQVLAKNKDKYPVLERANKILEQTVSNAETEIASIKEALSWYGQN